MDTTRGRRRFLSRFAGLAASGGAAVALAGCLDRADDEPAEPEPVVDTADSLEGETDREAWRDVETIRLEGWVGGWVGVEPPAIDRVENPTLVLLEGREYDLTWENRDGIHHNVALWDADRDVVREYTTDGTDVEGATETLTFEAVPSIATYRCEHMQEGQVGDVVVHTP
ncbi:cupredoxin domain-containing protein [Natrarchaeobaculum aegyptiacum]|uniref:Blue (type 1) copper domain-containing protein n=1 Tax=Natrarchaeobaculum aegyptiacum TaxID=745377 RepID=A0A2Z2HRX9_9EURY|nr:hypothetical protein [Natrarchaeobaculum aegyptiacum]ARS89832.1 hypothetical protein B1756_08825 [Natrarchaeobaculum aegyptiacum]